MRETNRMIGDKIRVTLGLVLVAVCLAAATVNAFFTPFINPALGDVVLFLFVLAGALTGFIAGYFLRRYKAGQNESITAAEQTGLRR